MDQVKIALDDNEEVELLYLNEGTMLVHKDDPLGI